MPLRKYQIARKAIDKTKLDDDAQVKVETQLLMAKGAGTDIAGNAGTTYAGLVASDQLFHPDNYKNISKIEFVALWTPQTTAGGLRLFNSTDSLVVATIEPGAVGGRKDVVDVTATIKGYTAEKTLAVLTRGDGTTAPVISMALLRIVIDTSS